MLNENIQALRKSKGLSQEELALKLNVVRQTVSKWERGLSVPDAEMLVALGETLDVPVSTLLGETVAAAEPDGLQALSEKLEVLNDQFARARESKRSALHALCIAIGVATALVLLVLGQSEARISNGISRIPSTRWRERCSTGSNGSLCGSRPSSCSPP
ncbi:helix-turn-helix domain-containing protein [Collinsella provencensis]|uniref:helix-turn-helix domain-containing protein n=1 Tax=Collinsella provencensis TaxID=1937461 RepID=UPI001F185B83|nr:helix-turn-helix transcriptional regulator [Collinsella provencensis]